MNFFIGTVTISLLFCQLSMPLEEQDFPYLVSLKERKDSKHLCSGSLLNLNWVLTSAQVTIKFIKNPQLLIATRHPQTRAVSRIYPHENFDSATLEHDIALVSLWKPFKRTSFVNMCRTPVYSMDLEMIIKCAEVEVVGYESVYLKSLNYNVISNVECKRHIEYDPKEVSFCATSTSENYVNDTGGPALCEGFVFGVTSLGRRTSVITRVDKHLEFLFYYMSTSFSKRMIPEAEKRRNMDIVIAVVTSVIVLFGVLIILFCTFGVSEKLKFWKRRK